MRLFHLACLLVTASAALAREPDSFAGDYGHGATHDAGEVVWRVQEAGTGWRLTSTGDGEVVAAHRLGKQGRAAFWSRMGWPVDSSHDASCLTWGEKPASLDDLLADAPPTLPRPATTMARACSAMYPRRRVRASTGWPATPATGSTTTPWPA